MSNSRVPVIDPTDPFAGQETWQNTAKGIVMVQKFTGIYGQTTQVAVHGGTTVHLTPAERRLNSEAAYNADQDPFRNGTMRAVRLIETEADVAAIEANPQALSDDDIREAFTHHQKLQARLKDITNPVTLDRFLTIGADIDAGVKSMERVRARIAEIDPQGAARLAAQDASAASGAALTDGTGGAPAPESVSLYDDKAFAGGITSTGA